eukprot:TRINITY_DN18493_c0_g1_i1.p1 TRINITY_DN18493_c0_g1~~TRINITY_DN18493_c0_g1_i1.p1  ORF type:complete len:608 (-),score=226.97 TRINITY_DN18493_c0_g1_i1:333-2156(-)
MEFSSVLSPPLPCGPPKTFEDFILLRFDYAVRGRSAELVQLDAEIGSRFGRHCVVVIAKLHHEPTDYLSTKSSLLLVRELFRTLARECSGTFVKMTDNVCFLLFDSAIDALRVCCSAQAFTRLRNKTRPDKSPMHFSAGIQVGSVLVITERDVVGDFYGDPVNISSKLAEDIALPDQILLSPEVEKLVSRHFEPQLTFSSASSLVSGVDIPHFIAHGNFDDLTRLTEADLVRAMCPDPKLPDFEASLDQLVARAMASPAVADRVRKLIDQRVKRSMPVLVSDMAGFTRITKSEGIQFCLMLIFKMRTLLRPVMAKQRGEIVSLIADDFVVVFPTAETCVNAAVQAREAIEHFNRMVDDRFQLTVHFALGFGDLVHNSAPFASVVNKELFGREFEAVFELGENIAEGHEILLTKPFYDALHSFSRGDTGLLNLDAAHGIRSRNQPEYGTVFEVTPFVKPRRKSASGMGSQQSSQLLSHSGTLTPSASNSAFNSKATTPLSTSASTFGGGFGGLAGGSGAQREHPLSASASSMHHFAAQHASSQHFGSQHFPPSGLQHLASQHFAPGQPPLSSSGGQHPGSSSGFSSLPSFGLAVGHSRADDKRSREIH